MFAKQQGTKAAAIDKQVAVNFTMHLTLYRLYVTIGLAVDFDDVVSKTLDFSVSAASC